MTGSIERRLRTLEAAYGIHDEPPCPGCGHGLQLVILMHEDEPEPVCETCHRPLARGEAARVITFTIRADGPQ